MPDAEFEKTFADLAHARLRDRAPGMLDHLIGFQLLDKNEDNTHAVGVWGFKIGHEWMYAPVFFLNGQLKGDELLYLKSQDAFVPLKENWINYLLNRRPHILGEAEPLKPTQLGMKSPDFNVLARPPYTGSKYASAGDLRSLVDYLGQVVHPSFQDFVPVIMSSPNSGKRAALNNRMSITGFLKRAGKSAAALLIRKMKKDAGFADAILTFYRMEDIIKAAEAVFEKTATKDEIRPVTYPEVGDEVIVRTGESSGKSGQITNVTTKENRNQSLQADGTKVRKEKETKTVTVTLTGGGTFKTDSCERDLGKMDKYAGEAVKAAATGDKKIEGTAPQVRVMLADRANVNDLDQAMLSDDEKEKLQSDRYVVQDRRGDDQAASVYHRQIGKTLQNPAMSSYCRVLLSTGRFSPMLVILNPHGDPSRTDGDKGQSILLNLAQGNRVRCVHSKQMFVDNEGHDAEAWQTVFDGLPAPSTAKEKDKVVFVNAKCAGTVPFFVRRLIVNADGQTMLYGEFDRHPYTTEPEKTRKLLYPQYHGRPFNPSDAHSRYDGGEADGAGRPYGYEHCFIVTGKDGSKVTQIGNDHFVPNGFKLIKVNPQDIEPWKLRNYARERKGETIGGVKLPGRTPEGEELASPQTLADIEMQLFKSGMLTVMQPITDGIQFWLRVGGQNGPALSKVAAIKELIEKHGLREKDALFMLKQAGKTNVPEFIIKQAQQPTTPPIPEPYTGYEDGINVPVIYPQTDLVTSDTVLPQRGQDQYLHDMDATYRAQQAANTGQKEVLDTSVVSGMIKTMDPEAAVDSYIGDLMLSLDRIGRILFMYYWHYDKFKERYGSQDMPELEDNLKNVFDNLGDLTLFLKQKTIEPEVSGATAEAELSEVM